MTAAIANNGQNPKRGTRAIQETLSQPMKNGVHAFQGTMGVFDGGKLTPGYTGLNLIAAGWFEHEYDNTLSTGVQGTVIPGARYAANSAGADLIALANVGQDCYIVDDSTVALTSGGNTRSRAGKIIDVDAVRGVCVEITNTGLAVGATGTFDQAGSGTMVAGVLTVNTGISITATSAITVTRKTKAGTAGVVYDCPVADRVVGIPGTGAFKCRAYDSTNAAATSDTSTIDWTISG